MTAALVPYLAYCVILALMPGPDNMFVLMQAATRGARAGFWITLGLCTGLLIHTFVVVVGLAAVIAASPAAFMAIKVAGAAYLIFLAWSAFTSGGASAGPTAATPGLSAGQYYRRGIIMNATNPKVALFFLAFLPQFTDAAAGPVKLQLVVLAGLFIACTLVVFLAIAAMAARLSAFLFRTPAATLALNRVAGVVFVLLAARLLLEQA